MSTKLIREENKGEWTAKDIHVFSKLDALRNVLHETRLRILSALYEQEDYPTNLAKRLNLKEQTIFYHFEKLKKTGLLIETRQKKIQGGVAKIFKTSCSAIGFDFAPTYSGYKLQANIKSDQHFERIFNDFVDDNLFDGFIVVGSPDPHGEFKARARDGHYAIQLALKLGQHYNLGQSFIPRLDTDIISENRLKNNLIVIGGPFTNLVTCKLNEKLPIRFNPTKNGIISTKTGETFIGGSIGMIVKIPNPYDKEKTIVIIAGIQAIGTKSAVLALTRPDSRALEGFEDGRIVEGFVGTAGKLDLVEVRE